MSIESVMPGTERLRLPATCWAEQSMVLGVPETVWVLGGLLVLQGLWKKPAFHDEAAVVLCITSWQPSCLLSRAFPLTVIRSRETL